MSLLDGLFTGGGSSVEAGSGLTKSGNTLSVSASVLAELNLARNNFVNVKDYGAVGNNVADDTAAIAAAIAAAPAGGRVFFPHGVYKISDEFVITKSLTIDCDVVDIVQSNSEAGVFTFDGTGNTDSPGGGIAVRVQNVRIVGGVSGITLKGPQDPRNSWLDNVYFINQTLAGLRLQTSVLGMLFRGCNFLTVGYGVYTDLEGAGSAGVDVLGNTLWLNCSWNGCGAGYYALHVVEGGTEAVMPNITLVNPIFQSLSGRALYMRNCTIRMINAHFEACCMDEADGADIHIEGSYPGAAAALYLEGGTFSPPASGANRWKRIKVLVGQTRVLMRDTLFTGGSANLLDADSKPNAFFGFEGMQSHPIPTVINGTWGWRDGPVQVDVKNSVRLVATSNIVLHGLQIIDGVATNWYDRVLVVGQTDPSENGIYQAGGDDWARDVDADSDLDVTCGLFAFVTAGLQYQGSSWVLTTPDPIELGTTELTFVQTAGKLTAGSGLTKTGATLDVVANADGSIVANADDIQVGVLATDAQHGVRGGGTQHALAVAGSTAGFMSGSDKQSLDDLVTSLANGTPSIGKVNADVFLSTPLTVAYAALLNLDTAAHNDFAIGLMTGDVAITLTNPAAGRQGLIAVRQDSTGGRSVSISATGYTTYHDSETSDLAAASAADAITVYAYAMLAVGGVNMLLLSKFTPVTP